MNAIAGATTVLVRGRGNLTGFTAGDRMTIGTPANHETVTIKAVGASAPTGTSVDFAPALANVHLAREDAVAHGTGLDLAAPLKFKHAANMPFSARGTGISVQAGDGGRPLEQRTRPAARHGHHARQAPGLRARDRRGGA